MGEIRTLCDVFFQLLESYDRPDLLRVKRNGAWQMISTGEFGRVVKSLSCGLMSLGVKPGDKVVLLSEDRPEWAMADFAILTAGAADVPLYPTLNAKDSAYIVNDSDAEVAIVSTPEQAAKLLSAKSAMPKLRDIIVMDPPKTMEPGLLRWDEILSRGNEFAMNRGDLHRKVAQAVVPEDLASIVYTSGTTGEPKGAMLTHYNFVENVRGGLQVLSISDKDLAIVFLPLSHVLERMVDYCYFWRGAGLAYAESIEKVGENMAEVRPTVGAGVPRFYEKVYAKIMDQAAHAPYIKKALIHFCVRTAAEWAGNWAEGKKAGLWLSFKHHIGEAILYKKVRAKVGGRLRFFISGGAPLAKELAQFFYGVGIKVLEGYGLTETTPVLTVNVEEHPKFGSIGRVLPNVQLKIAEDGELLAKGPNIMKGYYKKPEATAEVFTKDGWFMTGDIATVDAEGYYYITDRKKEILVTAGGKNVAPQPIENMLKMNKYVSQAVLIGDRRPYITALIVPNWENLKDYAKSKGLDLKEQSQFCGHPQIMHLYGNVLARTNAQLSHHEQIKKCRLLSRELTQEDGELTPTLKVKRRVIAERYGKVIESMYADGSDEAACAGH
ncbi:MAG: long-chain fatty acid--CoA ligase [Acidobacteria bacterium]|jgi:long-chain acyl-CoA synthetase|nr:long-chain fatty acid--CoA ligase [Acidobacteriota bacterium]